MTPVFSPGTAQRNLIAVSSCCFYVTHNFILFPLFLLFQATFALFISRCALVSAGKEQKQNSENNETFHSDQSMLTMGNFLPCLFSMWNISLPCVDKHHFIWKITFLSVSSFIISWVWASGMEKSFFEHVFMLYVNNNNTFSYIFFILYLPL